MKKRFTTILAFQGQNPLGVDIYKKYIAIKDRVLYHGHKEDTHLNYFKSVDIITHSKELSRQNDKTYDCIINHLALPSSNKDTVAYIQLLHQKLNPNGLCILSMRNIYPNLQHLHWYAELIPEASNKYQSTLPSQEYMYSTLLDNAFNVIDIIKPKEELILKPEIYYNPSGIYDPLWKSMDPIWQYVTTDELSNIEKKVSTLFRETRINTFIEKHSKGREKYGQLYFMIARKSTCREFF